MYACTEDSLIEQLHSCESKPNSQSNSKIATRMHMLSLKTAHAYRYTDRYCGVFDREFGFDSHEWLFLR